MLRIPLVAFLPFIAPVLVLGGLLFAPAVLQAAQSGEEAAAESAEESEGQESEGQESEQASGASGGEPVEGHSPISEGEHEMGQEVHDPLALSHANPGEDLYNPAEWRFDLAIFTFVVFLLLLGVLMKFAWGPIVAGLDKREAAIANRIDEAERKAAESEERLQQYEAKLAAATQEAQEILNRAHQDAEDAANRIRQEAEQAAAQERSRAVADIEAAKNSAIDELSQRSVDIAVGLAGQIVRKQLNPQDHHELIQDALKQFPTNN